MKKISGLTLIELMISLTIGVLMLGGFMVILLAAQKNHHMQVTLNKLQENENILTKILNSEIHQAGYMGCAKITDNFPIVNTTSIEFNIRNKVTAYYDAKMKINSQGFTIYHANASHDNLIKAMQDNSILMTTSLVHFMKDDLVVISDCKSVELFQIKNVFMTPEHFQKITAKQPLSKRYEINSEISSFEKNSYFVAKTSRKTRQGENIYALYVKDIFNYKQELLEGVDDMKINFVTQEDEQAIKAVSLQFVLSSIEYIVLKKNFYVYSAVR